MLTPRFEITQTDTEVVITVHAPYANIKETEVYVEGTDFRFYSTPYYLRLKLPGEIEENDSSSGSYDCEKGDFFLRFTKVNKDEYFENLDMITTLLAPTKKKKDLVPNIEVIGNPSTSTDQINENLDESNHNVQSENNDEEWYVPQSIPKESITLSPESPKYGFASRISGALTAFEDAWLKEIIDLPIPDLTPQNERRNLREKKEFTDFDEDYYLADLMEPDCVEPYILFTAEWQTVKKEDVVLSSIEVDLLKELPNREYLLSTGDIEKLRFALVDILFGSCYNHRTTLGENTVESSWTIAKLSSTLSWFDEFHSVEEVVRACIRRSLCYPLFRNWKLSLKVLEDVKLVLKLGKKYVIKRFCEIHSLFNNASEPRYILNQLYIKDFLIWLQQTSELMIESLEQALANVHPEKENMDLELYELEEAAYSVAENDLIIENAVHELVDHMDELNVNGQNNEVPKHIYYTKDKQTLKYLLSSSSSSSDNSDTDSESDSESSTSSTSTSNNSSLDSDDDREP